MSSARILIVDDDSMLGEQLRSLLAVLGHSAVLCQDAAQALTRIEAQSFDLIFCNYWLPGVGGQGFYFSLCHKKPALASRIVWLMGGVSGNGTEFFMRATGNPQLTKPYKLEAVRQVLHSILGAVAVPPCTASPSTTSFKRANDASAPPELVTREAGKPEDVRLWSPL